MSRFSLPEMPYALARKIVVAIIGWTLLLVGLCMLVLPGPGVLVLSFGLATLAIEFAWARRWLRQLEQSARTAVESFSGEHPEEAPPTQGHPDIAPKPRMEEATPDGPAQSNPPKPPAP